MTEYKEESLRYMKKIRLILILLSLIFFGVGLGIIYNPLSRGEHNVPIVFIGILLIILGATTASIASLVAFGYTLRRKMEEIHTFEQEKNKIL